MRADPPASAYLLRRGPRLATANGLRLERGQAVVEFALVLPIILLIILGILDFGRALNYKNNVTDMANQAARYAEVNACIACSAGQTLDGAPASPSSTSYIKTLADSGELENGGGGTFGILSPGATVAFCFPSGGTQGAAGNAVRVTVTATYKWLPFFSFGNTTISSTVTTRIATAWTSGATTNVYLKGGAATCTS